LLGFVCAARRKQHEKKKKRGEKNERGKLVPRIQSFSKMPAATRRRLPSGRIEEKGGRRGKKKKGREEEKEREKNGVMSNRDIDSLSDRNVVGNSSHKSSSK